VDGAAALEEKSALSRRMAVSQKPRHAASGARFRDMADDAEAAGETIRRLIAQLGSVVSADDTGGTTAEPNDERPRVR
jgi:two-component system, chemotaxis family, protein-glutamate methylesterase/glutaminase